MEEASIVSAGAHVEIAPLTRPGVTGEDACMFDPPSG
jgi:hypothetical protein